MLRVRCGKARYPAGMAYLPQGDSSSQSPATQLKSLQVIVFALMGGMLAFTGLATYMALTKGALMVPHQPGVPAGAGNAGAAPTGDPTLILYVVSGVMSAVSIVAFVALGRFAASDVKKRLARVPAEGKERAAIPALMTTTIIRAAFAEGAGLLGAVMVLLTGTLYTLGAVVIAAILLLMLMPVRSRMESMLAEAARSM